MILFFYKNGLHDSIKGDFKHIRLKWKWPRVFVWWLLNILCETRVNAFERPHCWDESGTVASSAPIKNSGAWIQSVIFITRSTICNATEIAVKWEKIHQCYLGRNASRQRLIKLEIKTTAISECEFVSLDKRIANKIIRMRRSNSFDVIIFNIKVQCWLPNLISWNKLLLFLKTYST